MSVQPAPHGKAGSHLVFLVHGIRTLMTWRRVLRRELATIPEVDTQTFYYGFFSLFRFYLPWFRNRVVRQFALEYFEQVATRRPDKVSVIAHSMGTYVVCRALQKYPLEIDTLILCGSVVPEREKFTSWFLNGKERVQRVVNDIADRDVCVLLGKLVIPGVGAAGLVGLSIPGGRLTERVFAGYRHGSFFNVSHYRTHWVPIVRGEVPTTPAPDRHIPIAYEWLIAWARPIKVAANLSLALLLVVGGQWAFGTGNRLYEKWAALPFSVQGPTATEQRPSGCTQSTSAVTKAVKLVLVAPVERTEDTFQIRVRIGLQSGSRWSIQDIESVGGGRVRMDIPNQDYWVYEVRPKDHVTFLICGGTDTSTGGSFLDDIRIRLSHAMRL